MWYSRAFVLIVVLFTAGLYPTASFAFRGYYLQASVGTAQQKMIDTVGRDLRLTTAWAFSGELGTFVTENTALGLRLGFLDNDESDARADWANRKVVRTKIDTNVYEAAIRTSVWIPRQYGMMLGAGAGVSHFTSNTGISSARRSATAPLFEMFAGLQHTYSNELMLFFRMGYSHRDFGIVQAVSGYTSSDPLDLDLSGWFLEIGIGGHTHRGWSSAE